MKDRTVLYAAWLALIILCVSVWGYLGYLVAGFVSGR